MTALRIIALGVGFFVSTALLGGDRATAEYERVVSGELVVTNAAANQFRIVGQSGFYKAPAATSVTALDGHTVRVDLSSDGRVLHITDTPVPIDPVTSGWSTVRGQLMVTDSLSRRFSFAGDDQSYVAPANVDVSSYAGKMVEIRTDESGRVIDLHPVGTPLQGSSGVAPAATSCMYRGQTYSAGAAVCQSGTQYRCDGSQWQSAGTGCEGSEAREASAPPRSPRSCVVGDATIASGSGICRDGTMFRCDDGVWVNARTVCR